MVKNKRELGKQKESLACELLKQNGYQIIEQNFSCRLGEIDIIAKDGKYLVFVEVKYRKNTENGYGFEAVDAKKQSKIKNTSLYYLTTKKKSIDIPVRYDVIEIIDKVYRIQKDAFSF
ncbi:MAG: YraN family protein [Lachnospiraceae bacterium]|nr:YraN family protein [Lachnospiraceae bacterium]